MFKVKLGVRGRILSIALVPSLVLLSVGIWSATSQWSEGRHAKSWAAELDRGSAPGMDFAVQLQEERRLTLLRIGGNELHEEDLTTQRTRVDHAMQNLLAAGQRLTAIDPRRMSATLEAGHTLSAQLPSIRQRADSGSLPAEEAYEFFNRLIGVAVAGMDLLPVASPTAATASQESTATDLFHAAEAMSRGNALAVAAISGREQTVDQLRDFSGQVGYYRNEVANLEPRLDSTEQASLHALVSGDPWRRLSSVEDAIMARGLVSSSVGSTTTGKSAGVNEMASLPLSVADWQDAATAVSTALVNLWQAQHRQAVHAAAAHGEATARNSLISGIVTLLLSVGAFLIAAQLATLLIRRLRRLRQETLALADEQLPRLTERLQNKQPVDLETDIIRLDFGTDEIGQVADAFNRAQLAAVTAAVSEAKTQAGVNALFLNIAYRSQVMIHRQLEVLDQAEREQEDPAQLDLLFKLDHLATRERRNAENLIILGGGQPGRQWRNPVPLLDVVRSAIAETENYTRVQVARLPEVSISGTAVADVIHLLAELVDNATSFSPPESKVEVTGNIVGKGIVVEVSDQGLGMTAAEIERVNETLSNPPDFSVTNVTDDSRLGLFVVALLAVRHNISVRLAESHYGGIRAIVVIPSELIAAPMAADSWLPSTANDVAARSAQTLSAGAPELTAGVPPVVGRRDPADYAVPEAPAPTEIPSSSTSFWNPPPIHLPPPPAQSDPNGFGHRGGPPAGSKPQLPRRRRQENLAPQLAEPSDRQGSQPTVRRTRSPEQARSLMSAIENGTRQGRQLPPDIDPYTPGDHL
ncbi:histidine kinase [Nocardia nova]|uniref:histidine kinase n=1 Tax=Nocardia nova TaxID=37330 RepID=A0A2S6AGP8_9NOCA|nr:nitrate- and nitrite sensing domain-containing protein [Nocardia nova]PPJ21604.1 histidine kinase [Nocardia nova]PPJ33934.1 histidine kinase [Nocardia nova]